MIEDDPDDALLVREMLAEARQGRFDVEHSDRLSAALGLLADGGFDVILMDLSLPDSQGLNTLFGVRARAPYVPVVVLSGLDDEAKATEAVRHGAQDYLFRGRGQVNSSLLERFIRYAIERQRLESVLTRALQLERQSWTHEEAMRDYHHYVAMSEDRGFVPGREESSLGIEGLPEPDNGTLHALLSDYRDLVQSYVRSVQMLEGPPVDRVRELAQRLAEVHARARDVIRLHLSVLTEFSQQATAGEYRGFSTDARLVLAELMGNTMDIYLKAVQESHSSGESEG